MKKRVKIPETLREQILKRDGYKCTVCGCDDKKKLVVHLRTPPRRGGDLSAKNLITLCKDCIPNLIEDDTGGKRVPIGGLINPVLDKWVDDMVAQGIFRSRSHGVEESISKYKEFMETGRIRKILP